MSTSPKTNPVIFIHGLWIHSSAWQPWLDLFADRGYAVSAPGWPGDSATVAETRNDSNALKDVGIAQIVDHYAALIGAPQVKPVLVGHSFGGLIAQKLLATGHAAAAVAIDPAPIKGVKALLLTSGTKDHTVPLKVTREVFGKYKKGLSDTSFHEFDGRGHSLTIDSGWRDVADVTLDWLAAKGL